MVGAMQKKALRDLAKKKARTIFTVLTIALGVMSVSLFAVDPMANSVMADQVEKENLHNLVIRFENTELGPSELSDLSCIKNVEGLSAFKLYFTKFYSGERKEDALFVGIPDPTDQNVDKIRLGRGSWPSSGQVLTEGVNSQLGTYDGDAGDELRALDANGIERTLSISGVGRSLAHGKTLYDAEGYAVFYGTMAVISQMSNSTGYNYLAFTLRDMSDDAVDRTIEDIRSYLTNNTGVVAFSTLPEIRQEGEYPGFGFLDMFLTIMYILTILAIAASMVLISNTMNTVVMEQRREIAMLKAVGATKVRIFGAYMTSALVMAVIGSFIGAFLGILVSFGLLSYFGGLMGFTAAFSVHLPTVLISIALGTVFVIVASVPALLKAMWVPVREGMEDKGIASNYGGPIDRLLMSPPILPRTVKMGIRNAAKRKGRSLSSVVQIAIAVAVFTGLIAFGRSLGQELSRTIDNMDYDIDVVAQSGGASDLNHTFIHEVSMVQGIDVAEPYVETMFELEDMTVYSRGYLSDTQVKRIDLTLEKGRWFDGTEYGAKDRVAVLGKQLATLMGIGLGEELEIRTATGTETLKVIGIDSDFYYAGRIIYLPMSTVQDMLLMNDTVTGMYLKTSSSDHGEIDRISVEAEDLLLSKGCPVKTDVFYKDKETTLNQNQGIVDAITYVSGMIVIISMVGLVSNITLNILDRTKEIGILRCIGGVSLSIRTIFTTEAVFLSIIGWALGIPFGYIIARFVSFMLVQMLDWEISIVFPVGMVLMSLALVIAASVLIAQLPILRATRMRPGDALRYE